MNRDAAIGLLLIGLLIGGIFLLGHKTGTQFSRSAPVQTYNPGNIKMVPIEAEPRRYKNKETRNIKYNDDGLPIQIEIIRDFAIT